MKKLAIIALATALSACSTLSLQTDKSVSGVFKGILPCADCEKIDAVLTLNQDKSYEYHTVYLKRGKEYPFTDKGTYSWDTQNKNVIRLDNSNLAILITGTYAELCGTDGKPVEGKQDYRLQKVAE